MRIANFRLRKRWIVILVVVALLLAGGYVVVNRMPRTAQDGTPGENGAAAMSLITIQPASVIMGEVSASGNIELVSRRHVALEVGGVVRDVAVHAGEAVTMGMPLVSLETETLERAEMRAQLDVDARQTTLAQLTDARIAAEVAAALAEQAEAQENLADVLAGPSDEEIAAARSNLSSTRARYDELVADPDANQLAQLNADLRKAEVAVAEAQRAYDQIAWLNQAGMTVEAARLQETTIDYERALAAFNESTAPANESDIQSSLSAIQDAQVRLDTLLNAPTPAEIAAAQTRVANMESRVADLMAGPRNAERRDAEISLEQTLLDLYEAHSNLAAANVVAPMDGVVLAINAVVGEHLSQNTVVATLADVNQLELTIAVAEVDIMQVAQGQAVEITIDALVGQTFSGVVEQIAPVSDAASGVVNYPVTIRMTAAAHEDVRPGMTAVATLVDTNTAASDLWLVPANAIQMQGEVAMLTVARGEATLPIEVEVGNLRNDWRIVQSAQLQTGDQVRGSVTSHLDEDNIFGGPGPDNNGG